MLLSPLFFFIVHAARIVQADAKATNETETKTEISAPTIIARDAATPLFTHSAITVSKIFPASSETSSDEDASSPTISEETPQTTADTEISASSTAPVKTVQATATSSVSTSYTSDSEFESSILDAHNFFRDEHNASALVWNETSAKFATSYARNCNFKHSGNPTGENLATGYSNTSAAVNAWGLERLQYKYNSPGFSEATGHFTQLVWKDTRTVGCGRFNCEGVKGATAIGYFVVCEYYPPGNVGGTVGGVNNYEIQVGKEIKGVAGVGFVMGKGMNGGSSTESSTGSSTGSRTRSSTGSGFGGVNRSANGSGNGSVNTGSNTTGDDGSKGGKKGYGTVVGVIVGIAANIVFVAFLIWKLG